MKKITLFAALIFTTVNFAKTSELNFTDGVTTRFGNNEPISFEERGIQFFVFQNGDFDFNTRPNDSQGDYFYKSAGRRITTSVNRRPENFGVRIEFDSFGRVRRVGNTFINYDFNDRVTRIGSVFMKYDRFLLQQVGGMRIIYNRFGEIIDTIGCIKGRNYNGFTNSYYGPANVNTCSSDYSYNYAYNNYNNDDFYYYKSDGTKAKLEDKKENKK
jgi:hypothetical protein